MRLSQRMLAMAIALWGTSTCAGGEPNLPGLAFEAVAIDLGVAGPNQPVACSFRFTNAGSAPLVIQSIGSSCGCCVGGITPWTILPSQTGVIPVSCTTARWPGPWSELIRVATNNPQQSEIRLTITARVRTGYGVDPESLSFGKVPSGGPAMQAVRLIDLCGGRLDLLRVEAQAEYLITDVQRIDEGPWKGFLIQVALNPSAPQGPFAVPLTLHTNLAGRRHIDVPVTGTITAISPLLGSGERCRDSQAQASVVKAGSLYVTRIPTEEDTVVSAWLIKRFIDPGADFAFIQPDGPMPPQGPAILFDLPSLHARWSRSARGCTAERILAGLPSADAGAKGIVSWVHQLEVAPWLVAADSEAGRFRSRMRGLLAPCANVQEAVAQAFALLDEIQREKGLGP
jgi:hypothetical protein